MRRALVLVAGVATTVSLALATAPATAHGSHHPSSPKTVTDGLFTALSFAVARDGTAYVSQNFAGQLLKVPRKGTPSVVYGSENGAEVGGVSVRGRTVTFAETGFSGDPEDPGGFTGIKSIDRRGNVKVLADTGSYELTRNPDGDVVYGARDLDDDCIAQWPAPDPENPESGPPPAQYGGDLNPHPYATLAGPFGTTFVADAGANTIQRISRSGRIRTLALMPAQPLEITPELAGAFGLPECAVGFDYYFDPVPTDVEWGPDGWLYVSLLPGGPEDPSLGARGAVYKVNPWTGRTRKVASGFFGATNLAVSPKGDIYVAELFGAGISVVKRGYRTPRPFASLPWTTAVEYRAGSVWASNAPELEALFSGGEPMPEGTLVKYRAKRHHHHPGKGDPGKDQPGKDDPGKDDPGKDGRR